ncbi:MAG TPA: ABC transporter substrate-binding protein [Chitinophagales bacterium]|nr:ABC transporter substrate-binding protein [Chitinophagales bacterium]
MIIKLKFIASRLFLLCSLCFIATVSASALPADSGKVYKVGLILPLQAQNTLDKINDITNARDLYTANRINFDEDAIISLDFYQGLLNAFKTDTTGVKLELHVYDNLDMDSMTTEILKMPELKTMDIIIGSVSSSTARLVADFCNANHILNIQPFSPSKSLTTNNPYHLKLAPTIDSHLDGMYQSILDSFPDANIIIYTPKNDRSLPLADHLDTLFTNFNATALIKYKVTMINATDQPDVFSGKASDLEKLFVLNKPNILIVTSYDEPFVQSTLRSVYEKIVRDDDDDKPHKKSEEEKPKPMVIAYGLPTWLNGDILRLDYLNDLNTRISDIFYPDTTRNSTLGFMRDFSSEYGNEPSRYGFLGYDVANFLLQSLKCYGKNFLPFIVTQRYSGAAYKFDIVADRQDSTINFYENTHVNVMKIADYRLEKVW